MREAGREALWRLVEGAHVFSQGYRPGGLAALGFSPEALAARLRKSRRRNDRALRLEIADLLVHLDGERERMDDRIAMRPDPIDLDPDLRRAGHVAGGMKRHARPADPACLAIGDRLQRDLAQPVP